MGIWDKITGQFIDVIEWLDNTRDTIVYRFDRKDNEIKYGAQLIVRESQTAVFINEGQLADVYPPGTHTLTTQNMPIMTTLKSWKFGFNSPFKAEVYFVNTRVFNDMKWGTKNPIMLRDAEFGPIRIRAFGGYTFKVVDAAKFLKELAGTNAEFYTEDIAEHLRNEIVTRFTDIVGESKIPVLDMAANYNEFSNFVKEKMSAGLLEEYGIQIQKVLIENISLPPEVEKVLDQRSSMGILGDLNKFTQFQTANAIGNMNNGGSGNMAEGMGMGMGFGMANQMMNQMQQNQMNQQNQQNNQPNNLTPPPPPPVLQFFVSVNGQQTGAFTMQQLGQMVQTGQLTQQTYVWKQGMAAWAFANQVPELQSLFQTMPPPPPPMA
jgi:membrane protease subunit (stomatin/prohibitin family)